MAAARSDTDREVTAQQLDAFHQTFNFCMTCRQYTCANCWNEAEGACLTCAPHLGHEILPAPFPDLDPRAGLVPLDATDAANGNGNGHDHDHSTGNGVAAASLGLSAWPASDLIASESEASSLEVIDDVEPIDAAARLAALTSTEPAEAVAESDVRRRGRRRWRAVEAIAPTVEAASDPTETDQVAATAAAQTAALLHRFRPGQNLDAEIEAYEREQAALEAETTAVAEEPAIEPIVPLAAAVVASEIVEEPVAEPVVEEPVAAEAPPPRSSLRPSSRRSPSPSSRPPSRTWTPKAWPRPPPWPPSPPSGPTSSSSPRGRSWRRTSTRPPRSPLRR